MGAFARYLRKPAERTGRDPAELDEPAGFTP